MNYIKQINAFWELEREKGNFTAHLQSFYFALLYFANKFGKLEFSIYREDIAGQAKLSNNTYYKVRLEAKEAGLITYQEGLNKRSKCTFSVLVLYQIQDTTGTQRDTPPAQEKDTTCDHTHKLTKVNKLPNLQTTKPQRKKKTSAKASVSLAPESELSDEEKKEADKEELSKKAWQKKYKDRWWQFYQDQTNGEEPPNEERHGGQWNALKAMQKKLEGIFKGDKEKAFEEFVFILESWQNPKNYHRHKLLPLSIHKNLLEIRNILRELEPKVTMVPYVNEAVDLYKDIFHQLKGFPPSINGKGQQHVAETLTYLKDFKEGNTWEAALKGFEMILRAWPGMEKQDKFYADNFTLSFINGNTSKIIGIIKPSSQQTEFGAAVDDYVARKYGS